MSTRSATQRTFHLFTADGTVYRDVPVNKRWASVVGQYWNAVDDALRGDPGDLAALTGVTVKDRAGNSYRLLTNTNTLRRVYEGMTWPELQEFNRYLYTVREVRRAS